MTFRIEPSEMYNVCIRCVTLHFIAKHKNRRIDEARTGTKDSGLLKYNDIKFEMYTYFNFQFCFLKYRVNGKS